MSLALPCLQSPNVPADLASLPAQVPTHILVVQGESWAETEPEERIQDLELREEEGVRAVQGERRPGHRLLRG